MSELWIGVDIMRRHGSQCDPRYAFTWAFVLAGFVNAFFQSTFEAPYTAVMFWTLLAVLAVMNKSILEQSDESASGVTLEEGQDLDDSALDRLNRPVPSAV